jgi:glycosyltransferase involved in cell wall biosynthesis
MILSMILIGENEAETLLKICENFRILNKKLHGETELIFVDSDSSDDSLSLLCRFREKNPDLDVTVIQIKGDINAAVARNTGLENANSNSRFIFFLDGDIVFEYFFVLQAISLLKKDKRIGSVTGIIHDCFTESDEIVFERRMKKGPTVRHHGGNFVTRKEVVTSTGTFDTALTKHQDIDYTFRIRENGYTLYKLDILLGRHYTTHYLNINRVINDLIQGKYFSSGILFRKYIFTPFKLDMILCGSIKAVILRLFLICLLLLSFFVHQVFFVFIVCIVLFLIKTDKGKRESISSRLISICNGIQFFFGLFAFPRKKYSSYLM